MGICLTPRRATARLGLFLASLALVVLVPAVAVAATASFSSRSPAPGTSGTNPRPRISVKVYARYGIKGSSSSRMYIDGAAVGVTRKYSDVRHLTLSYRPAKPLSVGTHRVSIRVRDRKGHSSSKSWTFSIAAVPVPDVEMPGSIDSNACGSCHVGFPERHPMTSCPLCHGPERPVPGVAYTPMSTSAHTPSCSQFTVCHRIVEDTTFPHVLGSCTSCHSGSYAGITAAHGLPTTETHRSANTYCTRSGCHASSLTVEHYRHSSDGVRLSCATCHSSVDPAVRAALASGSTDCISCHPDASAVGHPGLPAAHTSANLGCSASGCHATDLPSVHGGACAPCHDGVQVPGAQCTSCHTDAAHAALHNISRTDLCSGAACHDGGSLTGIKVGPASARAHQLCASCHASTDPAVGAAIAAGSTACASCHPTVATTHPGLAAAHLATDRGCVDTGCHVADLPAIHKGACSPCHAVGTEPSAQCATCHTGASHASLHGVTRTDSCVGAACHGGVSLTSLQTGTAPAAAHQVCATCHASSDGAVRSAISAGDKRCETCHGAFTDHASQHAVDRTADTCGGAGCHPASKSSLTAIHSTCAMCHGSSSSTVRTAIASGDKRCAACHAFTSHAPVHTSTLDAQCLASGCHASSTVDLTAQHATCATCHESSDAGVHAAVAAHDTSCVACHPDAGHRGLHALTLPAVCGTCHNAPNGNANLIAEHPTCDSCHASPRQWVIDAIDAHNTDCRACHDPHMAY